MRATTVAALLGNTGLFAPVARGSVVPRYALLYSLTLPLPRNPSPALTLTFTPTLILSHTGGLALI